MPIENIDQLINALGNNNSRQVYNKATITGFAAGNTLSTWRATGLPGQGAIPTTAALCTNGLVGGAIFAPATSPAKNYLAWLGLSCSNATTMIEVRDRIAHLGGLVGNLVTPQAANLDLVTLAPATGRIGDADYSDIQWHLEWYAATGATAATATVAVVYNDGATGNVTISLLATRPAGFMAPIASAVAGKNIRAVTSVQLSVSTATAGNFGVTASRVRTMAALMVANVGENNDWARLGLPDIDPTACLWLTLQNATTSTGAVAGSIKFANG